MKKLSVLIMVFISLTKVYSQGVYFYTGKNFTSYDYKNSNGETNDILQSGVGDTYEMGYSMPLKNKKLCYTIGLTLNEYNAIGGTSVSSYKWNTEYIGIQNSLLFSFLEKKCFVIAVKGGLNLSTILYGKQEINGAVYNLINEKEFSGLIIQPVIGIQTKFKLTEYGYMSLGYNYSKSINISNSSQEKLSFNTNQILFGIHFDITKKQ